MPAEKVNDYSATTTQLDNLRKRERDLLLQFTEAHPLVLVLRSQIQEVTRQKSNLQQEFPALARLGGVGAPNGTNSFPIDIATETARIKALSARVQVLGTQLSNIQAEASSMVAIEPTIAQLQRQRDLEEANYRYYLTVLEQARLGESLGAGKVINMSVVQNPTPPQLDTKKLRKLIGMVLAGCIGFGLGLAFLIDFVLDRTIRRSADVERHLHLPLFLSIPDTSWTGRLRLPWLARNRRVRVGSATKAGGNGPAAQVESAVVPWDPGHHLRSYAEGLRERLITYFDVNNLTHKPKLVAVTGCGNGSGVTTLASGLAAALSKTGDGNVLLVDMSVGQGTARSFYKGKPGCGLSDVLEPDSRAEAQVQENLYVASMRADNGNSTHAGDNAKLAKVLPTRFSHLVPKLRASDYDYIIFDMPPVSQTSVTPRLASYMDIVLLVLESEKTGQQLASRASALMRESRANIAAVLNKHRAYVPQRLSQEL